MAGNLQTRALARRIADLEKDALRRKQPNLGFSTIDDGSLTAVDQDGVLTMIIGNQHDGTNTSSVVTGPIPPVPTVALVEPGVGVVRVYWDGTFVDNVAPIDFARVTVHAYPSAGFTELDPTDQTHIFGSYLHAAGGELSIDLEPVEHLIFLVAWSQAGKFSDPSDPALGTPGTTAQEVSDAIDAELVQVYADIEAGDTANAQAIEDVVDEVNLELSTRPPTVESTSLPGATANVAGTIWEQYDSLGSTTRKLLTAWRGLGGTSWAPVSLDVTYIPQIDVNTGTFGNLQTNRLLVSDFTNLAHDPRFTGALGTWVVTSGDPAIGVAVTTGPVGGADTVVRFTTTAGVAEQVQQSDDEVPVTPGDSLSLSYYARWNSAGVAPTSGIFYGGLTFRDAAGVVVSTVFAIQRQYTDLASAWAQFEGNVTVPATAVTAVPLVRVSSTFNTGVLVDVSHMRVRRRFGGELIVDGGILARHITADMVSGLLLSGRIIQTNILANRGIKMSDTGLVGYDTAGVTRTVIHPDTGLISAQGEIQTIASGGYPYVAHRVAANAFESGQNWALSQYGIAVGWEPGQVWAASVPDGGDSWGSMRISAPYDSATADWSTTAFLDMRTRESDGRSFVSIRANEMDLSADTWTLGSGAGSVDFNVFGSNLVQFQQLVGSNRLGIGLGTVGTVTLRSGDKSTGATNTLELVGTQFRFDATGAHVLIMGNVGGSTIPGVVRNDLGSGLRWAANRTESHNGIAFKDHAASAHPIGSDAAWKSGVTPIDRTEALRTLRGLDSEEWTWQDTGGERDGTPGTGWVAQRVAELIPHAVTGTSIDDGGTGLTLDPAPLLAVLWAAVKELDARLDSLYDGSHA